MSIALTKKIKAILVGQKVMRIVQGRRLMTISFFESYFSTFLRFQISAWIYNLNKIIVKEITHFFARVSTNDY